MPHPCATCTHPQVREINHRIREGRPYQDISRWLDEIGTPITRQALARHHRDHLKDAPAREPGRKPVSADFLEAVRDAAHEGLADGTLSVTLRDGLQAQKQIDERNQRSADRDMLIKIGLALTPLITARVVDPEVETIEAEFRPLLTSGDTSG